MGRKNFHHRIIVNPFFPRFSFRNFPLCVGFLLLLRLLPLHLATGGAGSGGGRSLSRAGKTLTFPGRTSPPRRGNHREKEKHHINDDGKIEVKYLISPSRYRSAAARSEVFLLQCAIASCWGFLFFCLIFPIV